MLKIIFLLYSFSALISISVLAQDSANNSFFTFSGYIDAYLAYYSDSVGVNDYQKFPAVSLRSQQIGLNIAMLTAKYSEKKVQGLIYLHYSDIPKSSCSSSCNFIQEAN